MTSSLADHADHSADPKVALILGGARSGKSAVAEALVDAWAAGGPVTYVATARLDRDDPALAARVEAHRARRPATWTTVDAGDDLPTELRAIEGPVLLDALGPWVALHAPGSPDIAALAAALQQRRGATVVVSDEVGLAVHPPTEAGRWFVDEMGLTNQAIAAIATDVRLVVAGRTLVLPADADRTDPR